MKIDWLKDVSSKGVEAVEERKLLVRSAQPTLNVLKNIVEKKLMELEADRERKSDYDSPSWAYKQADYNGRIRELKNLITLLDQEENDK